MPTIQEELIKAGLAKKKSKVKPISYSEEALVEMSAESKKIKSTIKKHYQTKWPIKKAKSGRAKILISSSTETDIDKKTISYLTFKSLYLRDNLLVKDVIEIIKKENQSLKVVRGSVSSILSRMKSLFPDKIGYKQEGRAGIFTLRDKSTPLDDFYRQFQILNRRDIERKSKKEVDQSTVQEVVNQSTVQEVVEQTMPKEVKIKLEISGFVNFVFKFER